MHAFLSFQLRHGMTFHPSTHFPLLPVETWYDISSIHPPAYRLLQGVCILPDTGWIPPSALPVDPLDVVICAEDPPYGPTFPQQRAPRLTTSTRFHVLY